MGGVRFQPKPPWVKKAVIRLAARMPEYGCRPIAETFDRLYAEKRQMTVSKSYVAGVLRTHRHEIWQTRQRLKQKIPQPIETNRVWALDLTGKSDKQGRLHMLFGLLDHGSRACLSLSALRDKSSITILRLLLDAVEQYGRPVAVRTDNESVFISRRFRLALFLLGIRHQRTVPGCPWMNGRIERFWGTLKAPLRRWAVSDSVQLQASLAVFRTWYNHVRPHHHLGGQTPGEVWSGRKPKAHKAQYVYEWEGLLTGYYLPT